MISRTLYFLFAISWTSLLFSANTDYKEYLEKYPSAEAVTLSHNISISFYFNEEDNTLHAKSTHEITLMALKKGAYELNFIQIPFSSFEKLKLTSARYYSTDSIGKLLMEENVKVRFAEEKDYFIDNIFYSDLKVKQFSPLVDIVPGSVLKYTYEVIYSDLKFLNRITPQLRNDYVEEFRLELSFPTNVKVDVVDFNFKNVDLEFKESTSKENIIWTYITNDLKPTRDINYAPPDSYIRPHFVIVTKGWYDNKEFHSILNSTDDLYAWYASLISQLEPHNTYLSELSELICENTVSDEEKIKAIYSWVQKNVNYVAFEDGIAGFKPDEAINVAKQKYGDCKGISNLLVNLLNESGFDAHYAWIGTRHLPYDYSLPSIVVDNHMICALKFNGKWNFIDGTDNTAEWENPSSHIQGKSVLIGSGEEFEIDIVPIRATNENRIELNLKIDLSSDRFSKANGTMKFYGYEKNNMKAWSRSMEKNEIEKLPIYMSEYYLDYFICSEPDIKREDYLSKPMVFSGLVTGNYFKRDDRLILFCDISDDIKMQPGDTVSVPRFFENKGSNTFNFEYLLPNKSTIYELPDDISFTSSKGSFKCSAKYVLSGNTLKYTKYVETNTLMTAEDDLDEWWEFVYLLKKIKSIYVEVAL